MRKGDLIVLILLLCFQILTHFLKKFDTKMFDVKLFLNYTSSDSIGFTVTNYNFAVTNLNIKKKN